jgi:predicted porin
MMKKSLVALAALAVVGVASAQSSVTLYGVLDVGFGKVKGGKFGVNNGEGYGQPATGAAGTTQIRDGYNSTSVIGFRGSEDLGGGMKANFNLQSGGLDLATGGSPVAFSREAWVGLEGGFGAVQLGRSSSVAAKVMGGYDFNGTSYSSALDRAGVSAVTWYGTSRRSDNLQYASPNFGGFVGRASWTPSGDATANGGLLVPATAKDRVTLGLTFANGPLSVSGLVETKATTALRDAYAFGASYDFGVAKIGATYNRRELAGVVGTNSMASGAGTGGKGAEIGVVAPIGAFYVGLQYARNSETKVKATELFGGYNLSKRTKLYLDMVAVRGTTAVPTAAATVTANGLSAIPANPYSYGFGVVHSF